MCLCFLLVSSYEDEFQKKADLENEFVVNKKVREASCAAYLFHFFQSDFFTLCLVFVINHVCNVNQDVDEGHLEAVDLALELEDLMGKLDFLRVGFDEVPMSFHVLVLYEILMNSSDSCADVLRGKTWQQISWKRNDTIKTELCYAHFCPLQEIKELESQVQNQTVILRDDSKRSLDLDEIIESVKKQYENMANRSRQEAEHWNQKKVG